MDSEHHPADVTWLSDAIEVLRDHGYTPDAVEFSAMDKKVRLVWDFEEEADE
jgi:hypothetical protein